MPGLPGIFLPGVCHFQIAQRFFPELVSQFDDGFFFGSMTYSTGGIFDTLFFSRAR
ncbi:hypothetical protein PCL1606_01980 [Pseudomonas chlororaphis]|uniref:Uncharacterized protein n=1 Tax=Pseudomonas chlororaphis TaxID=587753 RepID=A0A0D5XRJ1_9PSED|nr:hypothetical protein PCL1606_01980 [Pseudomonas chlororaphis]